MFLILFYSTKVQIITSLKPLVALVSPSLDLTIVTNLNLGLMSVFFWGIPHLIRVTSVFLLLANFSSPRMLFSMKSNFLIQICFCLPLSLNHPPINPTSLIPSIPIVPQPISSLSPSSNSIASPTSVDPTADSNSNSSPPISADSSPTIEPEAPSPILEAGSTFVQDNSPQS